MARDKYEVLAGLNYPPHGKGGREVRANRGDIVDNLPPEAIAGLLEHGHIRTVDKDGD